ncbi:hypothetical protein V2J09_007674 [Rumex salicifolius]
MKIHKSVISGKRKKVVQTTNRTITLLELSRILSAKVVTRARTKRFVVLFPSKELDKFDVLNIGYDFVEVQCGITSRKYGDYVGRIKIFKQWQFLLRTKQECRLYHDACLDENWTCADFPNQEVCCEDDEERQPKKILRGCFMRPLCKGCNFCVCFGCFMCRFEDCKCRSCVDFIKNAGF